MDEKDEKTSLGETKAKTDTEVEKTHAATTHRINVADEKTTEA